MSTIANISKIMERLDNVILAEFISTITKNVTTNEHESCESCLLSTRLDIPIFANLSSKEYAISLQVTDYLSSCIINQQYLNVTMILQRTRMR